MNKVVKKIISALLSLILIFSLFIPAFSVDLTIEGSQIPVIRIAGDGAPLSDANGETLFQFNKMLSSDKFNAKDILQ